MLKIAKINVRMILGNGYDKSLFGEGSTVLLPVFISLFIISDLNKLFQIFTIDKERRNFLRQFS